MIVKKIKWISGILIVFILILATNLIDKDHFERIENSVNSIYEDRLVASDLIFEMSHLTFQKNLRYYSADTVFSKKDFRPINVKIEGCISRFYETELTKPESEILTALESNFEKLETLENQFFNTQDKQPKSILFLELTNQINAINNQLYQLSDIQIDEGKRQQSIASSSADLVALFTRFEIIALVILGLLIQLILLYNPDKKKHIT